MVRLGCCINNFNQWSFERAAELVYDLGFRVADVGKGQLGGELAVVDNPHAVAQRIREVAKRTGLALSEFIVFGVKPQEGASDALGSAQQKFRQVCRCAGEAGFESVLGSLQLAEPAGLTVQESLEIRATQLSWAVATGKEYGVAIDIEPGYSGPLVREPGSALWLAQQVPGLGYTLDPSHFLAANMALEQCFALLPHTRHIHAKQAAVGSIKSLYHNGALDMAGLVAELQRIGWSGTMVLECLAYSSCAALDFEYYEEVFADGTTLPAEGLVNHPVFQTVALAYELDRLLRAKNLNARG
jgi:sugar phosphate isomerase/epimerase